MSSPQTSNASKGSGKSGSQGFASMDPKRQKEISSMGGKASHETGNAHQFTPEEAAVAGRKGGQASGSTGKVSKAPGSNESALSQADQDAIPSGSQSGKGTGQS
jgi:uncharacterized protein